MKRILIIGAILVVLLGGSWLLYSQVNGHQKAKTSPNFKTYVVKRGNITAVVNASGNIQDVAQVNLSFGTGGEVTDILVQEGQAVHKGDLLAKVDQRSVKLQERQARANLKSAEARLEQLNEPADPKDVAAARANLEAAKANYDKLVAGPSADEVASAKAAVDRARAALQQAQAMYDLVKYRPDVARLPQSLQLQDATISYEQAQAQYRQATKGASDAQLASAKAQIAQAEAQLEKLLKGPDRYQVIIAQAQVETAKVALEQAKLLLEKTALTAPMDAVVAEVNLKVGQMAAAAGRPAIVLDDASKFHADVDVDELDIRSVNVGQQADITLDAAPDAELHGKVVYVSPVPTAGASAVSYRVRINLAPTDFPLRSGMSAVANIVSQEKDNVLLIPNRYIQLDRQTGQARVQKLVDGVPQPLIIQIGLRNDRMSEVTAGLQEGDTIALILQDSKSSLKMKFSSN